jgi:glycosyltransferase involved in cell wall biosynthesis
MKIAHILRRFVENEWGGTESVTYNYCTRLVRRGYEIPVYTTSAFAQPGPDTVRGLPIERFTYFYPYLFLSRESRHLMDKKGGSAISWPLYRRLRSEKRLALVHLHSMGRLGAIVRTACRKRGIPYVISLHGGHFTIPPEEQELFRKPAKGALCYGKPFGLLLGTRKILKDAAAILSVGRAEHIEIRKHFPRQAVYLPNGVDTARFAQGVGERFRKKHNLLDKKIILCLSRIDPQKGQLFLAQAMPEILKKIPEAFLVLIGSSTIESYRRQILEVIEKNDLKDRSLIISQLAPDGDELLDAYAACDVFVLPSIHEPFGIVALEAWAASRPVVASRIGGIPYFVDDGENGLLFESGDVGALAANVVKVLSDGALAARLGKSGCAKARESYDWDAIVARLIKVYEKVLSGTPAGEE